MAKRVILKDIADELNITINTVSRALKDKSDISEKTTRLVKDVALKLGYIPDKVASSMRTSSTKTIAVLFDNLLNPYFMIMANQIENELSKRNYKMMIFTTNSYATLDVDAFMEMVSRRVDGIITFLRPSPTVADLAKKMALPMVIVGREGDDLGIDSVYTNDYLGGYLMAEYFYSKNYTKVAYLGAPKTILCGQKREEGFVAYYKEKGIDISKNVYNTDFVPNSSTNTLKKILKNNIDAIFCFNDSMAFEASIYVNSIYNFHNIEITGYDNVALNFNLPIKIATIGTDVSKIISSCVNSLLYRITDPNRKTYKEMVDVYLVRP
ncbi:MAG: LacI family transcriptional regulator [Acholeplasmatales bacterium]|jgi:LacI family transcriptional regulator|nr:LacI family transcriptional regulator [Acholeplasmatales bacterium]